MRPNNVIFAAFTRRVTSSWCAICYVAEWEVATVGLIPTGFPRLQAAPLTAHLLGPHLTSLTMPFPQRSRPQPLCRSRWGRFDDSPCRASPRGYPGEGMAIIAFPCFLRPPDQTRSHWVSTDSFPTPVVQSPASRIGPRPNGCRPFVFHDRSTSRRSRMTMDSFLLVTCLRHSQVRRRERNSPFGAVTT